jgi:hypothetical protein
MARKGPRIIARNITGHYGPDEIIVQTAIGDNANHDPLNADWSATLGTSDVRVIAVAVVNDGDRTFTTIAPTNYSNSVAVHPGGVNASTIW